MTDHCKIVRISVANARRQTCGKAPLLNFKTSSAEEVVYHFKQLVDVQWTLDEDLNIFQLLIHKAGQPHGCTLKQPDPAMTEF